MRVLLASLAFFTVSPAFGAAQGFDHAEFDAVLRTYVTEAGVRYAGLRTDRAGLYRYVARLGAVSEAQFGGWSRAEQLAYLINAYNALVIRQVLDHYPIRRSLHPAALLRPANSVWQIGGFFDELRHPVAGRQLTLDEIEHSLLRAQLKEPRIHAALVCAAASCPPLRREAYVADRVDRQLDEQMRAFLADPDRNRIERGAAQIRLSRIFEWFAADFGGTAGVIPFIAGYVDAPAAAWLRSARPRITYFDYDWNLNDVSPR
ncbi:MAG: DUF547 domain-containing protein [Gemmatimonadota bacterium]